jgi:hypothetical protein
MLTIFCLCVEYFVFVIAASNYSFFVNSLAFRLRGLGAARHSSSSTHAQMLPADPPPDNRTLSDDSKFPSQEACAHQQIPKAIQALNSFRLQSFSLFLDDLNSLARLNGTDP